MVLDSFLMYHKKDNKVGSNKSCLPEVRDNFIRIYYYEITMTRIAERSDIGTSMDVITPTQYR